MKTRPKKTRPKKTVSIKNISGKKAQAKTPREAPCKRSECAGVPRPCPFVGCIYSTFLNVTEKGSITFTFGTKDPLSIPGNMSCVLDIVDEKKMLTLEEIGNMWQLSKERIRQIQEGALKKMNAFDIEWEQK